MKKGPGGTSTVVELRRPRAMPAEEIRMLVAELRRAATAVLTTRLTQMFDGADDLLFEFAERAASNGEQRLYFDTMRTVRLGRPEMLQRFVESLARGFESAAAPAREEAADEDGEDFTLQDSATLEKDIAIDNMAGKAEGLYKQALWEIGRKFAALVELHHAPMSAQALTPQAICEAFRAGAEALRVELGIELVIYKLFDRLVIGELGELYAKVLHLLKQHGVEARALAPVVPAPAGAAPSPIAPPTAAPGPHPAFQQPGPPGAVPVGAPGIPTPAVAPAPAAAGGSAGPVIGPAALPGWSQAIASMAGSFAGGFGPVAGLTTAHAAGAGGVTPLDPQTMSVLRELEDADRPRSGYDNARLAADLAAAARGRPIAGWAPGQAAAYVQRTGLVGQMFNDILADPHLPETLRSPFDRLRLSVIKTALKDSQFIADPAHPVRSLVNELAGIAAAARTAETESLRRIERLVDEIRSQFEIAAETLQTPGDDTRPMPADDAERFVAQQAAQGEVRRLAMIRKVRRIVTEELQLRTLGLALPLDVRPLIYSAWAPMMSVHLLRSGPESAEWRGGLDLLEAVLAAIDPVQGTGPDAQERDALLQRLRASFSGVGLAATRIDGVLAGLSRTLDALASARTSATAAASPPPAPPAAPAAPPDARALLDQLIVPGAWFRLFDHDRQCSRWLKAVALYPGMDCAAFAEFNGKNTLLVKSGVLVDDLAAQRAEPLDVSPATRRMLQEFIAQAAASVEA